MPGTYDSSKKKLHSKKKNISKLFLNKEAYVCVYKILRLRLKDTF